MWIGIAQPANDPRYRPPKMTACPKMTVAPMMERTDRHFRTLIRLLSRRTLLVTEMVTSHALIHGDRPMHLDFGAHEHPVSLQVGGDSPH